MSTMKTWFPRSDINYAKIMRTNLAVTVATVVIVIGVTSGAQPVWAQRTTPPPTAKAAPAGDRKSVLFNWMWYTGMLRGVQEVDAVAGGENTKVAMEGGKPVVTFPIPGVQDAIAKATLNAENQAERVETTLGNVVTEFTYEKYDDYNPPDDKVYGYFPGHIVEKRNGVTILDLTVKQTDVGNLYVVMPVPQSVRTPSAAKP